MIMNTMNLLIGARTTNCMISSDSDTYNEVELIKISTVVPSESHKLMLMLYERFAERSHM
jgi:hypothetical protein